MVADAVADAGVVASGDPLGGALTSVGVALAGDAGTGPDQSPQAETLSRVTTETTREAARRENRERPGGGGMPGMYTPHRARRGRNDEGRRT